MVAISTGLTALRQALFGACCIGYCSWSSEATFDEALTWVEMCLLWCTSTPSQGERVSYTRLGGLCIVEAQRRGDDVAIGLARAVQTLCSHSLVSH
jgi:hypothetical protein